jgi:hypothetical protein
MKHQKARAMVDSKPLDPESIRKTARSLFRRRNDYSGATFDELAMELQRFGVTTVKDLRLLMKKHRRSLLADENIRMSHSQTLGLHQEGFAGIDTLARKSWLAVPGLVRQAMEIEFGEEAAVYVIDPQA